MTAGWRDRCAKQRRMDAIAAATPSIWPLAKVVLDVSNSHVYAC